MPDIVDQAMEEAFALCIDVGEDVGQFRICGHGNKRINGRKSRLLRLFRHGTRTTERENDARVAEIRRQWSLRRPFAGLCSGSKWGGDRRM
jgi:hypothetical protein